MGVPGYPNSWIDLDGFMENPAPKMYHFGGPMNLETSIGTPLALFEGGTPPNGSLGFRLREPQIIKISRNGSQMKVEWNQRGSLSSQSPSPNVHICNVAHSRQ